MFKVIRDTGNYGKEIMDPDVFGEEYEEYDIASLVSTLLVIAMTGSNAFRIGLSSVVFSETGKTGEEGMAEFKGSTKEFVGIITSEMGNMSEKERVFFSHFVRDFEENGIVMPFVDRL